MKFSKKGLPKKKKKIGVKSCIYKLKKVKAFKVVYISYIYINIYIIMKVVYTRRSTAQPSTRTTPNQPKKSAD